MKLPSITGKLLIFMILLQVLPQIVVYGNDDVEEGSVEIINKDSLVDYPIYVISGGKYRVRLELNLSIPVGSIGVLEIEFTGPHCDPPGIRYYTIFDIFSTFKENATFFAGTRVVNKEYAFEISEVERQKVSRISVNVYLYIDEKEVSNDSISRNIEILPREKRSGDVEFIGRIEEIVTQPPFNSPGAAKVKIAEVLSDETNSLSPGESVEVWPDAVLIIYDLEVEDMIVVYGDYCPECSYNKVLVWKDYHYLGKHPSLFLFITHIEGLNITIDGYASPIPIGTTISKVHWDWGDGSSENGRFPASHQYSEAGVYTLTVNADFTNEFARPYNFAVSKSENLTIDIDEKPSPTKTPSFPPSETPPSSPTLNQIASSQKVDYIPYLMIVTAIIIVGVLVAFTIYRKR